MNQVNIKIQNRTIKKWSIINVVNTSKTDDKTVWIFFNSYYEYQEYEYWNDWQEGVGSHWKYSWKCKRQFKYI